jgi:hypothetical protein
MVSRDGLAIVDPASSLGVVLIPLFVAFRFSLCNGSVLAAN